MNQYSSIQDYLNQSSPQAVTVQRRQETYVWITLPGDIASHKLTESQARTLLRKLEEVV